MAPLAMNRFSSIAARDSRHERPLLVLKAGFLVDVFELSGGHIESGGLGGGAKAFVELKSSSSGTFSRRNPLETYIRRPPTKRKSLCSMAMRRTGVIECVWRWCRNSWRLWSLKTTCYSSLSICFILYHISSYFYTFGLSTPLDTT